MPGITVFFTIVFIVAGCSLSSKKVIGKPEAFSRLEKVKSQVARTGGMPAEISGTVGSSGFFYIIGKDGVVRYHPSRYVVGTDMSNLPMVKEIFSRESGVGTFEQGGIRRTVYFTELPDGSRLCLSLDPEETE